MTSSTKTRSVDIVKHSAILVGSLAAALALSSAMPILAAGNLGTDFTQCANADSTVGSCHWIVSILNQNNSAYIEGMTVPQRMLLTDIPATSDNVHTLTFEHEFTKGGVHAYDFLTGYNQANSPALTLNACADFGGNLGTTCSSLRSGTAQSVSVPDDAFVSKDGTVLTRTAAFEGAYGDRQLAVYGDATFSGASLSIGHDVADLGDTTDSYATYTLTWTSASSNVLIELAGHLAISGDGTGDSWGAGLGIGAIAGGPAHFKFMKLDGDAIGSQDNQIMAVMGGAATSSSSSSVASSSSSSSEVSSTSSSSSSEASSSSESSSSLSSSSESSSSSSVVASSSSSSVSSQGGGGGGGGGQSSSSSSSQTSSSVASSSSSSTSSSSPETTTVESSTDGGGGGGGGHRGHGTTTGGGGSTPPPSFGGGTVESSSSPEAQIPPPSYGGASAEEPSMPGMPHTGRVEDAVSEMSNLILWTLAAGILASAACALAVIARKEAEQL